MQFVHTGVVLLKGQAACEIDTADELLTAELMFNGTLIGLDKHQLVSRCSMWLHAGTGIVIMKVLCVSRTHMRGALFGSLAHRTGQASIGEQVFHVASGRHWHSHHGGAVCVCLGLI